MTSIFGVFNRDGKPVLQSDLDKMQTAMPCQKDATCFLWHDDSIVLGQLSATGSKYEHGKVACPTDAIIFIAAGRLDNASELADLLRIPHAERDFLSDIDIMRIAYGAWGVACSIRFYGDWCFAAWHPSEKRLTVARDQHGNTALYYYMDHKRFAFATSRKTLLELNLIPVVLDELYLAQYLTSLFTYFGDRTLHTHIRRIPTAHYMTVTSASSDIQRYWRLEETPELLLRNRHDYVDAFRDIFSEAVRCRLPSTERIGISMSGGLDSGSVAAVAARHLQAEGRRLSAFTAVPLYCPPEYTASRFNDEYPMAMATTKLAGNIDLYPLTSASISPIAAIRRALELNSAPSHGASNLFWVTDIRQTAKSTGCTTLLNGVEGNGGMSWTGNISSQSLLYRMSHLTWRQIYLDSKRRLKTCLPNELRKALQAYRMEKNQWWRGTAINHSFAQRSGVLDMLLSENIKRSAEGVRHQRCRAIMPGYSIAGAMVAEASATYGLKILDPTADTRVLAFSISVPDHIFIDPNSGQDRWLIREAMKGYLPDEVRLNRKRGLQSSDLVLRLRDCADDVEDALDELSSGAAAEYVDVDNMRQVWRMVLTEDTPNASIKASSILCRGIMAGLFVNRIYD